MLYRAKHRCFNPLSNRFCRLRVTHGHRNANDNGEETPEPRME